MAHMQPHSPNQHLACGAPAAFFLELDQDTLFFKYVSNNDFRRMYILPVEAYIPAMTPRFPYHAKSVDRSPLRNANSSANTATAVAVAPAF